MFLALTLTSLIPLLILTHTLHIHAIPLLDARIRWMLIGSLQGLLVCTALLVAGGGYVIWDVAAAVVRTAQLVAGASKAATVETPSFGTASLPEDDSMASSEILICAADEALYAAKRGGKNAVASYKPEATLA